MFLYIYLYTVLKTDEQLFRDIFFLCQMCWSINHKGGSTVGLCFLIMSYKHPPVWLKWMTEVCVCCFVCTCVFVHLSVCAWVTGMAGCIIPVLQVSKGRLPRVKTRERSLPRKAAAVGKHGCCTLAWYGVSPLFSFIEPLFHFKEPLPI